MVLFSKYSPLYAEHIDVISSDVREKPKAVAMANANLLKDDAMQTLLRDLPQFVVEPTRALFACQVTYYYNNIIIGILFKTSSISYLLGISHYSFLDSPCKSFYNRTVTNLLF